MVKVICQHNLPNTSTECSSGHQGENDVWTILVFIAMYYWGYMSLEVKCRWGLLLPLCFLWCSGVRYNGRLCTQSLNNSFNVAHRQLYISHSWVKKWCTNIMYWMSKTKNTCICDTKTIQLTQQMVLHWFNSTSHFITAVQQPGTSSPPCWLKCSSEGVIWMWPLTSTDMQSLFALLHLHPDDDWSIQSNVIFQAQGDDR